MSKQFKQQFKPLTKQNDQEPEVDQDSQPIQPKEENRPLEKERVGEERYIGHEKPRMEKPTYSRENYSPQQAETVKVAARIPLDLNEKLKAFNYWERTSNDELIFRLLADFLKNKDVPVLPREQRLKKKRGRKPKNYKSGW